jgi:GNAT superfamily N-acetyltransferase
VVGTIAAAVIGCNVGHLRGMAVQPGHHGAGVAALLLETAEAELRRLGCTTATLDTTAPLHRAMKFYEKHGYRQSGTRHQKLGMELIEHRKTL